MKEREAFYDEVLAPALLDLAKQAHDKGLSFLAVVEWDPDESGRTAYLQKNPGWGIRLANLAAQCGNNFDQFLMNVLKAAKGKNHSSILLARLGEPIKAEEEVTG